MRGGKNKNMENICLRQYQFSHVDFHVVGCCNTLIGLRLLLLPLHNEIAHLWNKVRCYMISVSEAPADSVFMIESHGDMETIFPIIQWYSTFSVRLSPNVISLQLCATNVVGI